MRKFTTVFILLVFGILIYTQVPNFSDLSLPSGGKSYTFDSFEIAAEVQPDGSMMVQEIWTVTYKGSFSKLYMDIPVTGFSEIRNIQVYENGTPYEESDRTSSNPPGYFSHWLENGRQQIEWYYRAQDETKTFAIHYEVMDCVKVHDDIAELYWKFIGDENLVKTDRVEILLTLPPGAEERDLRAWGHGPLHGDVSILDSQQIRYVVENLPAETFVEARVLFPTGLVPEGSVKTGMNALGFILAEEARWQEEARQQRLRDLLEVVGGILIGITALAGALLAYAFFGKRFKPSLKVDYYRELAGNYSPAEAEALYSFKKFKTTALVATLMDLARRDFLRLEPVTEDKKGLGKFLGKTQEEIYIRLLKNPDQTLLPHEVTLMEFLFPQVSVGQPVLALSTLNAYAKKYPQSTKKFWDRWKLQISQLADQRNFFDKRSGKMQGIFLLIGFLFVIGAVFLMVNQWLFPAAGTFIGGLGILFSAWFMRRRSQYGEDQLALWHGFRQFLKDFSNLDRASLPHLILWEHYLVYAVVFGVAKEVISQLPIVYPELNDPNTRFARNWYYTTGMHSALGTGQGQFLSGQALNNMLNMTTSMERTWNSAFQTVNKALSGSSSSSGGGGGGFSGGGGGGGGGGGRGAS